jgi:hypothetical protein
MQALTIATIDKVRLPALYTFTSELQEQSRKQDISNLVFIIFYLSFAEFYMCFWLLVPKGFSSTFRRNCAGAASQVGLLVQ